MSGQQRGRGVETAAARSTRRTPTPAAAEPYRVVVRRVDGSTRIFGFASPELARRTFLDLWRETRSSALPKVYTVAVEELDGTTWRRTSASTPNAAQIRARHEYLTRQVHRARRTR